MAEVTLKLRVSLQTTEPVILPTRPVLYQVREDKELFGYIRSCAPCPAVVILKDDPHTTLNEQWQYYLRAINYAMTLENVYLLLDHHLAFANNTGFRKESDPKADYFHRLDLDRKPPNLDKVRTCSRSVLTGQVVGDKLKVTTFDSRQPPPLKTGRSYPSWIENVNPNDYLYMPQTFPWMFLVANIVNKAGYVVQFPRGGLYEWTKDNTPYSFLPHISNPSYGAVLYPLSNLRALSSTEPIPSPYRSNL